MPKGCKTKGNCSGEGGSKSGGRIGKRVLFPSVPLNQREAFWDLDSLAQRMFCTKAPSTFWRSLLARMLWAYLYVVEDTVSFQHKSVRIKLAQCFLSNGELTLMLPQQHGCLDNTRSIAPKDMLMWKGGIDLDPPQGKVYRQLMRGRIGVLRGVPPNWLPNAKWATLEFIYIYIYMQHQVAFQIVFIYLCMHTCIHTYNN